MKLIALCGAAGSGKDTVADLLPYTKLAFADVLYEEVAQEWRVDVCWLKDRSVKDAPQHSLMGLTPRELLCMHADMRRKQDPLYFVNAVRRKLEWGKSYVITDVRFENEARMVRSFNGEVWQVVRPGVMAGATGHISDTDGSEFKPDRIIVNDGSIKDLKKKV